MDFTCIEIQAFMYSVLGDILRALISDNIRDKCPQSKHGRFQTLQVAFELNIFITQFITLSTYFYHVKSYSKPHHIHQFNKNIKAYYVNHVVGYQYSLWYLKHGLKIKWNLKINPHTHRNYAKNSSSLNHFLNKKSVFKILSQETRK